MIEALYLHVPFCASRCRYCDFATSATRAKDPLVSAYAKALARLMVETRKSGLLEQLSTAYIGGGTPTFLGAAALRELIAAIPAYVSELSFEANPESLDDDVLDAALKAGATRVSIGVQSFFEPELQALGRIHTGVRARGRVRAAVARGFSTSVDLMCGIPRQTRESWERTLAQAVDLGASHISCYPLQVEEKTPFFKLCENGKMPWPDEDFQADLMQAAAAFLGQRGFHRYEVASYAKPGAECQHNKAYWTGVEYLGLGTSAASMLGKASYAALRDLVPTLPAPEPETSRFRLTVSSSPAGLTAATSLANVRFEVEQLNARQAASEDLMLGLRMSAGISENLIEQASMVIPKNLLQKALAEAEALGLARRNKDRFQPTEQGWLLGNKLYGLFLV